MPTRSMRKRPRLWTGSDHIQWGCVLMHLMGEQSLTHLHIVLAGLRSVENSRQAAPYAQAIQTARSILGDLRTRQSVQNAVYDFLSNGKERSFQIDPITLSFRSIYAAGLDPNVETAEETLHAGLPRSEQRSSLASVHADLVARPSHDTQVPIRLHGLSIPEPSQHNLTRWPRQPLTITLGEIRTLAEALDTEDRAAGRSSLSWSTRVNLRLQETTGHGLSDTDRLDLTGLKHMIGLPGSGKTTLIQLLCILLQKRGRRTAVFFTSIAVARDYLELLKRYDIHVALIMGRSGQTHRRHANDMAELIAGQGRGGFARTREGAELFATSCPLPAFADRWPSDEDWPIGVAPCESITDAATGKEHLCPVWERCGRVKNQRELVQADVWLGHILSSDTSVPAHTAHEQLRFFELIAETFDLIIIDECDETQSILDGYGTLTLELTGNEQSIHNKLLQISGSLAANRTAFNEALLRYTMKANEFERHTLRFLAEIHQLSHNPATQRLASEYTDTLLTANFLIQEAIAKAGSKADFSSRGLSAVSDLWESAMYRAFFERGDQEGGWRNAERYAAELGMSEKDAQATWRRLNTALNRYLQLEHAAAGDEILDRIAGELRVLLRAPSIDVIRVHVRLLVVVGFTVASYQNLAIAARPLAQQGDIPTDISLARASLEMRTIVPRSILGSFSAVRYRRTTGGFGITYLVMDAAPRLLLSRLHEIGRAHVLLTSATSWLPTSTEYHVDYRPNYVLIPPVNEFGPIRLYLLPKRDPASQRPLFFSSAGNERDQNLRHMVTALVKPELSGRSELERAVRAMHTLLGRPRKVALVVNSYEQVQIVVEQIHDVNRDLGRRTRGLLNVLPSPASRERYALKGQVEELGMADDVDVLVFPIAALGRGVNIVFHTNDDDDGRAAVGSVYFLTRPHPAAENLSLMTSLLARATQELDTMDLRTSSLADAQKIYNEKRWAIYRRIINLLARPLSASRLDKETRPNFAANLLVPILQTIGRGIRKRMPVDVYFVDAAWAPNSAEERPETDRSSILLTMRDVLENELSNPDPDLRDVAQALYGIFREAFNNIDRLIPPRQDSGGAGDDMIEPSFFSTAMDWDATILAEEDYQMNDDYDDGLDIEYNDEEVDQ